MNAYIPNGVWPTMITPFTDSMEIDYTALEALIEWYIGNGVEGLFAVCQSSEMFCLSLEERVSLTRFVKEKAAGRVPVIASGHISYALEDQLDEIQRISETGIDAFVMVSNRLAGQEDADDIWKKNAEKILSRVPETPFGIYECPYPYKRLVSPELLKWCSETGRFLFLKDTSCNVDHIRAKVEAVKESNLKIFNANSVSLLESLKLGAAGFSGVMANFHPELYVWLCRFWNKEPEKAQELQNFLGVASLIELQMYPVNAKYYLQHIGINIKTHCRTKNAALFTPANRMDVEQLCALGKYLKNNLT